MLAYEKVPVPCGKCPPCKKRRTSGWSFRLVKEGERALTAYFVTLTYNTDNVPLTKNGFMTLQKTDLQKYFKRLRKLSHLKLKYYAVGEYGSRKMRPHYHIILFNAKPYDIEKAWTLSGNDLGTIHIGQVNDASIGYTLKYMCKESKIPMHKNDDRQREFSLMSKGLGSNYITDNKVKWHKSDLENRMYVPLKDGKKASMPRYYREKIYNETEKQKIYEVVAKKAEEEIQELKKMYGENYSEQLLERHKNQFRKMFKQAEEGRKTF